MAEKSNLFMTRKMFLNSVSENQREEAEEMYIRGSFRRVYISGIVFLFIAIISLTSDITVGFYNREYQPYNFLNLIALLILIFGSSMMVVFGLINKNNSISLSLCRMCHFLYYIFVDASLLLMICNEFFCARYLSYEMFYWIFFSVVPLIHLKSNIINTALMAVVFTSEFALVMIYNKASIIEYIYFIPLLLSFCLFGLYLRGYYMQTIIYDLKNRELNEQLRFRSELDPLTCCLNRYMLHERFEKIRDNAGMLGVMMFDIDFFKQYNDGFSHLKGDECLSIISERVGIICNQKKADFFRYGGEEFVVFSPGLNEENVKSFAKEIVKSVADLDIEMPDEFNDISSVITVSLGVVYLPVNSESDMKSIISAADAQMYLAKENGKNCVFYQGERL